ncbi:hypothetical protein MBLNU230_g3547t1 [Neophaeotheca triangularis]
MTSNPITTPPPDTPFWNTNLPPSQQTPTCPPYLLYALSDPRDRRILNTPDSAYTPQTWTELNGLITTNRIDLLQRQPSDLLKYRKYSAALSKQHGSIMDFIVNERLRWDSLEAAGTFRDFLPEDVRVLKNDWPYGLEPGIVHLVVWTKFELLEDAATGDLTDECRGWIEGFVRRVFVDGAGLDWERVRWFRNWTAIKSVRAVEHFHVVLLEPPGGFVEQVTGGDVALIEKVGEGGLEVG